MMSIKIDSSVQPFFQSDQELRAYLPEAFKSRGMPDIESVWYQAPGGDYHPDLYGDGNPGSNVTKTIADVFADDQVDIAVLNPLTRGNIPDFILNSEICAATNRWLAETWLTADDRLRGTIRVNPEDVEGAVAEIERWADDERMVQVGVPLQSREPYGKPQFRPIWEVAAARGLPVAVRINGGAGIDFPPTLAGHARTYPHYISCAPLNFFIHLANLIIEGCFDRISGLQFIFADGGADAVAPLMWRLDSQWTPLRDQTPWVEKRPSEYLRDHVRFCTRKWEGPGEALGAEWLNGTETEDLLMYASNYPFWYWRPLGVSVDGLTSEQREKVAGGNAANTYTRLTTVGAG
jgi:uncharacterized protein